MQLVNVEIKDLVFDHVWEQVQLQISNKLWHRGRVRISDQPWDDVWDRIGNRVIREWWWNYATS